MFRIDRDALVHFDPREPCEVAGHFQLTTKEQDDTPATGQNQSAIKNVLDPLKRIGLRPQLDEGNYALFWFDVSSPQRKAYYMLEIRSRTSSRVISDGIDQEVAANVERLDRTMCDFILLSNALVNENEGDKGVT